MITRWFKERQLRKMEARLEKKRAERLAEEQLDKDLQQRGVELKQALIEMGMIPANRINRNLTDRYVMMYAVLDGRLVRAEMGVKGYMLLHHVKEEL